MLKVPILRQAVRTADGFQTSKHKGLRYSTYAYYLDRLGWGAGFEQKLTAYCPRRCTGNAVNGERKQPAYLSLSTTGTSLTLIASRGNDHCGSRPDHATRPELGYI
jgi:hypothetical protein